MQVASETARAGVGRVKSGWGATRSTGEKTWLRVPSPVRTPVNVIVRTIRLYGQDDCSMYAAAIAYYALFSLVPLALITLSVFGLFVDPDAIVDWVFNQFPLEETQDVRDDVLDIVEQSKALSGAGLTIGLITLYWSASGLFGALRRGLNATRRGRRSRPFWQNKLLDLLLVLFFGVLITLSISVTTFLRVAIERAGDLGWFDLDPSATLQISLYFLSAAISFVTFLLLYKFVPASRPTWKGAIEGAALATVLFEGLKNLGALLIGFSAFSQNATVYSTVSVTFGFLFWVYLNASIILLGSEFIRAIAERRKTSAKTQSKTVTESPSPG